MTLLFTNSDNDAGVVGPRDGYLRAEYLITYTPSGVPAAGWHNVQVPGDWAVDSPARPPVTIN